MEVSLHVSYHGHCLRHLHRLPDPCFSQLWGENHPGRGPGRESVPCGLEVRGGQPAVTNAASACLSLWAVIWS
jgi:hypothetical protein